MTLGEKLLMLRKSKGMSQEQLSTQMAVSRQAISKWELGESIPDTENIIHLSKLFGVSIDYLLHDEINSDTDNSTAKSSLKDENANKYYAVSKWYMVCTIGFSILFLLILVFSIMGDMEHYGVIMQVGLLMKGLPILLLIILSAVMAILYRKKAKIIS